MSRAWIAVGIAAVALVACDRTHMSPHFGVANREAFRVQVTDPKAGAVAKPDQPLDPEEAAIIAKTYQRSLAPANAPPDPTARGGMLVVPPTDGSGMPQAPGGPR